jgi:thiamine biosynthesis lipoprotein
VPTPDQLAAARSLVNWRNLEFDSARARLTARGMRLDFGAIAKGYAAEAAVRELERQGTPSCLVSIAGDVFAGDLPPGSSSWRIAVQSGQVRTMDAPPAGPPSADNWIELHQAGCSTSGDTEQVITVGGVRQAHIIDIRTGLGSPRRASVTVIAPHGWQSDALATAIYLLDEPAAQHLLSFYPGCRAIIYEPDGDHLRNREINSAAVRMSAIR